MTSPDDLVKIEERAKEALRGLDVTPREQWPMYPTGELEDVIRGLLANLGKRDERIKALVQERARLRVDLERAVALAPVRHEAEDRIRP